MHTEGGDQILKSREPSVRSPGNWTVSGSDGSEHGDRYVPMTRPAHVPRRLGRIGVGGLLVSLFAAFVHETPGVAEFLLWFLTTAMEILFLGAVVLAFLVGFAVIIYSHRKQRQGDVSERVHHITGIGVCSVLGLSLAFPVVLIDDILRLLGPLLGQYGPGVPTSTYFYASVTLFGAMTFIRVLDVVTRRLRAATA